MEKAILKEEIMDKEKFLQYATEYLKTKNYYYEGLISSPHEKEIFYYFKYNWFLDIQIKIKIIFPFEGEGLFDLVYYQLENIHVPIELAKPLRRIFKTQERKFKRELLKFINKKEEKNE